MTNLSRGTAWVLPLFWVAGCGVATPQDLDVESESAALVTSNGQMQNGQMQNGQMQNGQMQNGAAMQLTGVDLRTMRRLIQKPAAGQDPDISSGNTVAVPDARLDKTALTDGVAGTDFKGTIVWGLFMDENHYTQSGWVYIEDMVATADPEIFHYVVKANHRFVPAAGHTCDGTCPMIWDYICGTITRRIHTRDGLIVVTVPQPATAVGGQWDYHEGVAGGGRKVIEQSSPTYDKQITFACSTGAIGKCVETMHYKPWALAAAECTWFPVRCEQPTQELLHEACVRMVRADYCGDGRSHTINGITVDVWDQSQLNTMTPYATTQSATGVPFGHEAEWTANGARCLSQILMPRTSHLGSTDSVGSYLDSQPQCHGKWTNQVNQQQAGKAFRWEDGDCFGHGPVSQHSTFDFANVPASMDLHDRVLIKNKSVCIDDGNHLWDPNANLTNAMKYAQPWCAVCLPDGTGNSCPPPVILTSPLANAL